MPRFGRCSRAMDRAGTLAETTATCQSTRFMVASAPGRRLRRQLDAPESANAGIRSSRRRVSGTSSVGAKEYWSGEPGACVDGGRVFGLTLRRCRDRTQRPDRVSLLLIVGGRANLSQAPTVAARLVSATVRRFVQVLQYLSDAFVLRIVGRDEPADVASRRQCAAGLPAPRLEG